MDIESIRLVAGMVAQKARDRREPANRAKTKQEQELQRVVQAHLDRQAGSVRAKLNGGARAVEQLPEDTEFENLLRDILLKAAKAGAKLGSVALDFPLNENLTNKEAAEYARQWANQLSTDIDKTTLDIIRQQLQAFVETPGMTLQDLIDGLPFDAARAERIAVTEVTRAYAEGNRIIGEELEKEFPGVAVVEMWFTNNDDLVCEICGPLDGKTVGLNEPFVKELDIMRPPAHPNCILPLNEVLPVGVISAAAKAFYDGRCIELTLDSGRRLTVTENHPILTMRGWVAAQHLTEFDNVLVSNRIQRIATSVNPNNEYAPSSIEQIFSALEKTSGMITARMKTAAEDFHGDSRFFNGDVNVIYSKRLLWSNFVTRLTQLIGQKQFNGGGVRQGALAGNSAQSLFVNSGLAPARSSMGRIKHLAGLGGSDILPAQKHTIGNITRAYTRLQDTLSESPTIDPGLSRKFLLRFSSDIAAEQVRKIRDFNFAGHVYDLQCDKYQLYFCNSIITHNCRCWTEVTTDIER